MKIITGILVLIIGAFIVWPYLNLYRLNNAVLTNNITAFEQLIDIESIRRVRKQNIEWKMQKFDGNQGSFLPDFIREGAKIFENVAIDRMINSQNLLASLRQINGSLWQHASFIFFQSPTTFIIRLGKLVNEPLYIEMTLQGWAWRVTAIYE